MIFAGIVILTVTSIGAMPMPRPISGDVEHVMVSEIFMEQTRIKRSDSYDCQFPPTLLFQFDVQGEKVILQLEKNVLLSRRIPIYVTKNGQSYQEKNSDIEDFATYQDVVRGSSMLVFCQEDGTFKLMDLYFYSVTLLDPSLRINVYLAGIEVPERGSDASWSSKSQFVHDDVTYVEYDNVLNYVKQWTKKHEGEVQYDHVMAMTRLNLVNKNLTSIIVGQAFLGTFCDHPKSVSVIDASWPQIAATAVHELAHSLGAYHDGTQEAKKCSMFDLNLMSPLLPFATNITYAEAITTFSSCSVKAFKCHINRLGDENCMKQHSFRDSEYEAQKELPFSGAVYSLDQQCQFYQGLSSSSCVERLNESSCYTGFVCSTSPISSDGCNPGSYPLYPLAGTPCGEPDDDKWCYRGVCMPRQTSTTVQPPGTTTSTTVSPFCSKKCCIRKSNGKKKCCKGLECCEVNFGRKLDCCTLCNQLSSVSTTVMTTPTTTSEQCYEGECCKRILIDGSKKKVCCTGKKCCKRSWGINTKCCKTCG